MPESILHLDDFDEYLRLIKSRPIVAKFTAEWCGACKRVVPKFKELAEKYAHLITFIEIDIDDASEITNYENIQSIPLILAYRNGIKRSDLALKGANESLMIENITKLANECMKALEVAEASAEANKKLPQAIKDIKISEKEPEKEENSDSEGSITDDEFNEFGENCDLVIEKTIEN